jgi:putative ABC transport system substrate-binding protein
VLTNSSRKNFTAEYADLQAAAAKLQLTLEQGDATKPGQIDTAINGFSANVQAILVTADPMFNDNRGKVVRLIKNRATAIPAIYQWRDFVTGGGLMSYGPSIADAYKTDGAYVGQILDGDSPKDMPVRLPSTYELVINLKTTNKMGFKIPTSMLMRATLVRRKG